MIALNIYICGEPTFFLAMKKYLFALSFFIYLSSFSQDTLAVQKQNSVVSFSLQSPVFGYVPRYNTGYMHRLSQNWWVGTDLGYGSGGAMPGFGMAYDVDNNIGSRYRFFEVRPEIYYDLVASTPMECMISVEYFYMKHTDTYSDGSYEPTSGTIRTHYATADYTRIKQGVNLNLTTLIPFTDNLGMVIKAGAGLRSRDVKYTNVVVEGIDNNDDEHYGFGSWKDEGNTVFINLNADLRLYYRF